MPVKLPKFESSYGQMLTVCGQLKLEDPQKGIPPVKERVAAYQSGKALVIGQIGGRSGRHLHIDCVLKDYLPKRKRPKTIHKKADITSMINSALGLEMEAGIIGYFKLPLNDLPENGFVRIMTPEMKSVDMSVRMTACSFAFCGVPINRIDWRLLEDEQLILVRVAGEQTFRVSEDYLVEMWEWINRQFSFFILREKQDG